MILRMRSGVSAGKSEEGIADGKRIVRAGVEVIEGMYHHPTPATGFDHKFDRHARRNLSREGETALMIGDRSRKDRSEAIVFTATAIAAVCFRQLRIHPFADGR